MQKERNKNTTRKHIGRNTKTTLIQSEDNTNVLRTQYSYIIGQYDDYAYTRRLPYTSNANRIRNTTQCSYTYNTNATRKQHECDWETRPVQCQLKTNTTRTHEKRTQYSHHTNTKQKNEYTTIQHQDNTNDNTIRIQYSYNTAAILRQYAYNTTYIK